jgi:glutathione synthase/RimK-type ligase-like ATP-grasp enzyme
VNEPGQEMLNFVTIANPENRRLGFFQQALEHCNLPPATVVNYADLIAGKDTLERFDTPNTIARFDSPERNFEVDKAIIAAGANVPDSGRHQRISAAEAMLLEFDKGRILYPRQWYLGWRDLLQQWHRQLPCPTMNHPSEIAAMFDKPLCHELFSCNGIPVPRSIPNISNYEELRQQMKETECVGDSRGVSHRVFVKLSHGSGASGVVAYYTHSRGECAITTVERVRENGQTLLYNSRKIRQYTRREEIADIINILAAEGVQVEEWLPKAYLQGCQFDVRVVVINHEAQHIVVRLGKSPMTNLHLGNDRGDTEQFLTKVGSENWEVMKRTCEAAASLFPRSLYCGVDLLVAPDFKQHAILEINAFGDLLPGILWQGTDTYTSEVKAMCDRVDRKSL